MAAARFCDSTSFAAASPVRLVWPTTRRQVSRLPTCAATSRSQTAYWACRSADCSRVVVPGLKNSLIGSFFESRPMPTILPKVSAASFLRPVFQLVV
jgi:hypothetical protein